MRFERCARLSPRRVRVGACTSHAGRFPLGRERPTVRAAPGITSASSATSLPSACSTKAGSTRCSTHGFPTRSRLSQSWIQRRRDRDAASVEELRHAGRVAERQGRADRRLSGESSRRHEYQGGRHLRVLRLQRVLCRRSGLATFKQQLDEWITHTLGQKYNGKSAPRIVLFSPIAHENLHNPDLPDGSENNRRLELYTRAMSEVATAAAFASSTCSRRPRRFTRPRSHRSRSMASI